jgi:lauroyl/myristoyl acyltransferase
MSIGERQGRGDGAAAQPVPGHAEALRRIAADQLDPPLPSVPLGLRLATSEHARRLLPDRIAVAVGRARGARAWRRRPEVRAEALRALEAVVGGTAREAEALSLARRHVCEHAAYRELYWQPWRLARVTAASEQNLQSALTSGRGVILTCCHVGPRQHQLSVLAARGVSVNLVTGPWLFAPPGNDYWGRRLARRWREARRLGQRMVVTGGSYPLLVSLLRAGEAVELFFDMPGPVGTSFLGKQVMLSGGTARLARETAALLLPVRARLVGHRIWADFAPPIDPLAAADTETLHARLAALHERWILEQPEALEDPNRPGAWEGSAGPGGWRRPPAP